MQSVIDEIVEAIQRAAAARPEIVAAYLFGSVLTTKRPNDIDIAFLVRSDDVHEIQYPFGYRADLTTAMMAALRWKNVDVVVLNQASPLLAMQVLRTGRAVFSRNQRERLVHEKRIRDLYLDTAPLRRIQAYYLKKRYLVHAQ